MKRVEVVERSWKNNLPLPLLSCESWMSVKEIPNRKKIKSNMNKGKKWLLPSLKTNSSYFLYLHITASIFKNQSIFFRKRHYGGKRETFFKTQSRFSVFKKILFTETSEANIRHLSSSTFLLCLIMELWLDVDETFIDFVTKTRMSIPLFGAYWTHPT